MVIRLTDYIERGVIDNRQQDLVMVELYFKGREEPLVLNLEGNCHRDIAGARLEFKVKPEAGHKIRFNPPVSPDIHHGLAGDITASRRVKSNHKKGFLSNALYFEAFIKEFGLLLIDCTDYDYLVSSYEWVMEDCQEQAQIMSNQQILRDYIQSWVKQFAITQDELDPLPDHHWDIRLREAEGMAIAYQEVHYKYWNQPCADVSEAFVMGWDDMLGELADSDENGTSFSCSISGSLSLFDLLDEEEAIETQLSMSHPLFQQIINITEETQRMFSREINDLQIRKILPPEELSILFQTIRYVTPNVLSCLLQINEGNASHNVLAERLNRCAKKMEQAIEAIPLLDYKGIEDYEDMFSELRHDMLEMRGELLKQEKL